MSLVVGDRVGEQTKKIRYVGSFLQKKLIHTNLQLLYDCNFRCRICDFWKDDFDGRPRLSPEQVEIIAEKLNRVGPQIVSIGGGEPLMHEEIVEIVRALSTHHFPVMICNGWFVTPELARALFSAGMYEISVSVDYASSKRHDRQRGQRGAFERAIEALRILHENRTEPHQRVQMISVIMDDNIDEVEPLIELCAEMGITYMVTLYSDSRGRLDRRAPGQDVSSELLRLKRKHPHFVQLRGYVARFTDAVRAGGIGPCLAGKLLCNIDSQGNVSLCIDRLDQSAGNILHDDMELILERLDEVHRRNRCRSCWTSCRGAIETLMHGNGRVGNALDYFQMTRSVPLDQPFGRSSLALPWSWR